MGPKKHEIGGNAVMGPEATIAGIMRVSGTSFHYQNQITKLPCSSVGDQRSFSDEKAARSGPLRVIFSKRRPWNSIQRPASRHRR